MNFESKTLVSSPIEYGLCLSEEDFIKTLKKLGMPSDRQPEFCSNKAWATTHFFEGLEGYPDVIIVTMREKKGYSLAEIYALLVHEAVHVWQFIKRQLGETCSIDSGYEFEAYGIQGIAFNLISVYDRHQLQQKEKLKKARAKVKTERETKKQEAVDERRI